MDDIDSDGESLVGVKQEVEIEEHNDDHITYRNEDEDCQVFPDSLKYFFIDDFVSGGDDDISEGRIHPDCLPAPQKDFTRKTYTASLEAIKTTIKEFIETCIRSKEDPKCSQEFYGLIHRQLYIAWRHNLVSSHDELDNFWLMFDKWAKVAYEGTLFEGHSETLKFQYERILIANDPTAQPPNPTDMLEREHTPEYYYRLICTDPYKKGIIRRMEISVHKFITRACPSSANFSVSPVRDDLRSRVKFYLEWRSYHYPIYKTLLDFYWNILLNRRRDYYERNPLPTNLLVEETTKEAGRIIILQTVGKDILRKKKFQRERIIKNCINECIELGIDPRTSHKFHWTIHRCFQAVYTETPENRISVNEMLRIWKKFDVMAVKAFSERKKFDICPPKGSIEFYDEANELPPPLPSRPVVKKLQILNMEELKELLIRKVKEFVLENGSGDDGHINPILGLVQVRRKFLMTYVSQIDDKLGVEDLNQLNFYWNELISQTCNKYKGWRKRKLEKAEEGTKFVDRSKRGRVLKKVEREKWGKLRKRERFSLPENEVHSGRKFDMERLVKNVVNICIERGVDPRISHRFHWTVFRCIRFENPLLSECRQLKIWRKYEKMALERFLCGEKFPIDGSGEYFENCDELEIEISGDMQRNGGRSLMNLRAGLCITVMDFVTKYCDDGDDDGEGVNRILEDLSIRRKFFLSYVEDFGGSVMSEDEIDGFWKTVVSKNRKTFEIDMGRVDEVASDKMEGSMDQSNENAGMNDIDMIISDSSSAAAAELSPVIQSPFDSSVVELMTPSAAPISKSLPSSSIGLATQSGIMATSLAPSQSISEIALLQGDLIDVSNTEQRNSFLQIMSCVSNKFVVKIELKTGLLTE